MQGILLDNAQNCSHVEVLNELFAMLLIAEVVAPWEEPLDLQLVIEHAVMPEVLTEARLRCQLAVVRKVIIPLRRLELVLVALLVRNVESNVERVACEGCLDPP